MVSQTTAGPVILLIRIGSIRSGLNTTGAPNISGSLILNRDGPIQILPMVFSFLLLERSIKTFNGSVPPRPPMVIRAAVNTASLVAMFSGAFCYPYRFHLLHSPQHSWGIRPFIYWESIRLTGSENLCSRMISNLSSMMRYSLGDPQEDVLVEDELEYLEKYISIMKLRYPDLFEYSTYADPGCSGASIKKMLLQPLIENSIYHGLRGNRSSGRIQVYVHQKHSRLYFTIYDTGKGMTENELEVLKKRLKNQEHSISQHIGLSNTNARLILAYGSDSRLQITSKEGKFTVVWFSIPINP